MTKYTDILASINRKDPVGVKLLFQEYGKPFYKYCTDKWGCDRDAAWDIVYRTLETLTLKLDRYEFPSEKNFRAFLYHVLMNYIRKHYRASQAQKELIFEMVDFNGEQLPKELDSRITESTLRSYYEEEDVDHPSIPLLRSALAQMDKDDREILLLRAQNFSYKEIGDFLGIDDPNLKVKYLRAKKKLIQLMTDHQIKGEDHENN